MTDFFGEMYIEELIFLINIMTPKQIILSLNE